MADADFTNLHLERDGAVATIRLDRPKQLNALDADTLRQLAKAVRQIRRDAAVRALVITGTGKAFCAGADIAAMRAMAPGDGHEYARLGHEVFGRIESLDIPVIAAVNGAALGGGLELALSCDLVIAAEGAKLGLPETSLGLIPGFGGTQRLVLKVGMGRARELIYRGRVLTAAEARGIGLVERVIEDDRLAAEVQGLAAELAGRAPVALREAKRATRMAAEALLAPGLRYEVEAFAVAFASEDRVEGLSAFLEKRKADWKGR